MAEANVRRSLRGLVLSAVDLQNLTDWNDSVIEDYLNIFRNLERIATSVDETIVDTEIAGISLLTLQIPSKFVPEITAITSNLSTTGNQTVICNNTSKITVTLNDEPEDFEEVNIKRANATVEIDGNGKTIDGETLVIMSRRYTNLHLVYTVETDAWNIV